MIMSPIFQTTKSHRHHIICLPKNVARFVARFLFESRLMIKHLKIQIVRQVVQIKDNSFYLVEFESNKMNFQNKLGVCTDRELGLSSISFRHKVTDCD